jgi:hypothetical protein
MIISGLTESDDRFHKFRFFFKHWQMATIGNEFHLGVGNVFSVSLSVSRRHQAIVIAPEQQHRTANPMQPAGQLGIVRTLPS